MLLGAAKWRLTISLGPKTLGSNHLYGPLQKDINPALQPNSHYGQGVHTKFLANPRAKRQIQVKNTTRQLPQTLSVAQTDCNPKHSVVRKKGNGQLTGQRSTTEKPESKVESQQTKSKRFATHPSKRTPLVARAFTLRDIRPCGMFVLTRHRSLQDDL